MLFFWVKTVFFFIVSLHAKQSVNKIEDKDCLKFVMLFEPFFGLLHIIMFFSPKIEKKVCVLEQCCSEIKNFIFFKLFLTV